MKIDIGEVMDAEGYIAADALLDELHITKLVPGCVVVAWLSRRYRARGAAVASPTTCASGP